MTTIKDILGKKGGNVWSVTSKSIVYDALKIMDEKDIGALVVVDDDKVVGIFSERDYARKVILKGRTSKEMTVSELMTTNVLYINPEQTIDDCMALMSAKHVRHLPVMDNKKLLGMITIGDVVNAIISTQQFTISELENYISGGGYGA